MRPAARYLPLAIAIALAGCITPSIPIPPPDADRMDFGIDATAGTATFAYEGDANFADAIVYVFNRDTGGGVIATADGNGAVAPTEPFPATVGDEIAVTFETEEDIVSTCVILREGRPDGTLVCSP
jgi:hypothetical protein